jgi:hypothetical protein
MFRLGGRSSLSTSSVQSRERQEGSRKAGAYIIYEPAGPFYVDRSSSNIQRRLSSHLKGTGSRNVKLARKISEVRRSLTFTYVVLPKECQCEVEGILNCTTGNGEGRQHASGRSV